MLRNDIIEIEVPSFFRFSMHLSNLPGDWRLGCAMIKNDHKEKMDNNL